MSSTSPHAAEPGTRSRERAPSPDGARGVVRRHPLLVFAVSVIGLTWIVQFTFLALGWPLFPALVIEIATLLATATWVTHRIEGRAGVRRLFASTLRWRFGASWYAVALLMLPLTTIAVAAVTGTLTGPAEGWGAELFQYLFLAVVFGALLGNMWEELAWTGFLQDRITAEHGLVKGVVWTAVPFTLIHLPLAFEEHGLTGTGVQDLAVTWTFLIVVAPFFRLLIGLVYQRTGRSTLAVALLHGSFNASGSLSLAPSGWEYAAALLIVTTVVAFAVSRTNHAHDRAARMPG